MKVLVVRAGAIGGFLAVKLSLGGALVSVRDQGAHLEAIRRHGLRLRMNDGSELTAKNLNIIDDLRDAEEPDVIILAVKAHQIADVAPGLSGILAPHVVVLTVQNGIPWWYFQSYKGVMAGTRLRALDPDGLLERCIPADRILGCVAYPASTVQSPGMIHHVEGNRFPVGELDGSVSERACRVATMLNDAGLKSFVIEDIRSEIWLKAWGALSLNPISALTRATMLEICRCAETRALVAQMMGEAQCIAEKLGVSFRHTIEKRISGAEQVGQHKTSMLQDVEAGRPLEIDAVLGAVAELGDLTDTPCPSIKTVYACAKLLNQAIRAQTT
jgi:2-dehydropantoate 2-reductase